VTAAALMAAVRRRVLPRRVRCYATVEDLLADRDGLEIGGPTDLFRRRDLLPAYAIARSIDNANFSRRTVWNDPIRDGASFTYDARRAPGRHYIVEATALTAIAGAAYDFVLASHVIEHVANPLRALREWRRVLKPGGAMVLVVPHKERTFDHRRPVTALAHLEEDDRNGTSEDDLTHVSEILALHDLALDPPAGDFEAFKARSERNADNRCLHHHVFDTSLAVAMADAAGLQIVAVEPTPPYHIFLVACNELPGQPLDNARFLGPDAEYRRSSPFITDRPRG